MSNGRPDSQISAQETGGGGNALKLYWFIPDGLRADPDLFTIYEWAGQGELPNIKKMMDNGAYGYSIPVFPSHTPVNFATLLTGSYPKTHGVADGPMHVEGRPLDSVAVGGFSSAAKKVPPIWSTLEENGEKVLILSTPGSTPPEIQEGVVIRGRWGGWGADFHAINFQSKENGDKRRQQGRGSRLFYFGPELTQYVDPLPASGWENVPPSFSPPLEVPLASWGATVYAYAYDSTDDGKKNYDHAAFSLDKKTILDDIVQGQWGNWHKITLKWQGNDVDSDFIPEAIILDEDGFFRLRIFYNNVNRFITQPSTVADQLTDYVGPMMDFVDNYPAQLVYYPEDKEAFLQEMNATFAWHTRAIPYIVREYNPAIVIHDIYSPNQMLTSRWWMGYVDPHSARYGDVSDEERRQLWGEVKDMYKDIDRMIGEIMANADENTIIVLSSDHGAVPLDKYAALNNLFANEGLLKFTLNKDTGEPIIDWNRTQAIYLKMDNVYINPNGLAGDYHRASGPEYEALRDKVIQLLISLQDENGKRPVASVTKWEDVEKFLDLPADRTGDLIVANEAGYGWSEEMSDDLAIFSEPLISGYKQAIHPDDVKGMWTPFIVMGPGVKKGHRIEEPVRQVDQYPTLMTLLGEQIPDFVEGKPLPDIAG